ncbi:MAG: hypothetical protein J5642_04750 [Bacteroidales bacterium]|nr:hypothetical protein [Bacteroidales bacterium]
MNMGKKIFLAILLLFVPYVMKAQVSVTFTHDTTFKGESIIRKMEGNLSNVLTEINNAYDGKREINLGGLPMTQYAKEGLSSLWANSSFFCDDSYVVVRMWNFSNGYMVRQIPLLITPRDNSGNRKVYQEAVVEFDVSGNISDFKFASLVQMGESLEHAGDPVDVERKITILSYCDRFRTAYNTKDIQFMQQVFSEDALIITGTVITSKAYDGKPISSVKYKKQNKAQYIANLKRAFDANEWIDVKFSEIGTNGEGGASIGITRSTENPNLYGVRLRQEWKSSRYSDEGYVFLLWDFTNEDAPVIHVRTWQPEWVGGKKLSDRELFSLEDFEN